MLKFEVYISSAWHIITPEYKNFKLIKERDPVNILQAKITASGELLLFGADFDLLIPYISTYNIPARITEQINGSSVYDCYLNLDNTANNSTDFISAKITIKDIYYNAVNAEININTQIQISDNVNTDTVILTDFEVTSPTFDKYNKSAYFFTKNGYNFKTLLSYLVNEVFGISNVSNYFFDNEFDNLFFIDKNEFDKDYLQVRDIEMAKYYAWMYENPEVWDDEWVNTWNEKSAKCYGENYLELKLNDILTGLADYLNLYWYIQNNTFYLLNYKDFVFNHGIDLTNHLGVNWNNEALEILRYRTDKVSEYSFINSDTIFTYYKHPFANNPFYTRSIKFDGLKENKKDITFPFTVNFQNIAFNEVCGNCFMKFYRNFDKWKDNISGNGMLETDTYALPYRLDRHEFINYQKENDFENEYLTIYQNFILPGNYYQIDASDTLPMRYYLEYGTGANIGKIDKIGYIKEAAYSRRLVTKWMYLRFRQEIQVYFKCLNYTNLYFQIAKSDGTIIYDDFVGGTISKVYSMVPEGYFYFIFYFKGSQTTSLGHWEYITDFRIEILNKLNAGKVTTDVSLATLHHYNTKFSPEHVSQNFAGNFSEKEGKLIDVQYDNETVISGLQKENDRTLLVHVPINKNIDNIYFTEKMKTNQGWFRLDRVERNYNKDYNSFCTLTLTNNE